VALGLNEIAVTVDIAEYRKKEKLWSRDVIWRAAENMSPLTWWKGYCRTRHLSTVAMRILSIPATAAPCERNWKTFSLIKTKKRNRLTNERTQKLVAVAQNLSLFSEEPETSACSRNAPDSNVSVSDLSVSPDPESSDSDTDFVC
jgi:hypothetical protein